MSSTRIANPTATIAATTRGVPAAAKSKGSTLLALYLTQLATHPLRTKCITSGVLQVLQEMLANRIAGVPPKQLSKDAPLYQQLAAKLGVDARTFKMSLFGFFVSAPLSHVLTGYLQKAFVGKTATLQGKLKQVATSSLTISPIMCTAYLVSVAIINGARSVGDIAAFVKKGFRTVYTLSLCTTPASILFAQYCLPLELWVPWLNFVTFGLGTVMSVKTKKMALQAKRAEEKKKEQKEE